MKKIFVFIIALIAISIIAVYLFIPSMLIVTSITTVHGSTMAVSRILMQDKKRSLLLKNNSDNKNHETEDTTNKIYYNNDTFNISKMLLNGLQIDISNKKFSAESLLTTLPLSKDSIALHWSFSLPASKNPVTRFIQYLQAVNTKKNMSFLLQNMSNYLSKTENIYGISVSQTSISDTTLVSTSQIFARYPSTAEIYGLIQKLQDFIIENHSKQTGSPLLNISKETTNHYKVMVAVPTNLQLPSKGDIMLKRMIPGNFLTTTIVGGYGTVDEAYRQMQQYFEDHQRVAMAIPFQVLVTDRLHNEDTTKWVTKLYFPVF